MLDFLDGFTDECGQLLIGVDALALSLWVAGVQVHLQGHDPARILQFLNGAA
jgi:hypothetical protein